MIKVCVCITTYNLKDYIRQALDSVLAQKTEYEYKIIVADDCSTDGTIDILKEYKEKYPEKFELALAEKNSGSLSNSNRIFDGLQCEYFTFLDGDDYWCDDNRIQKQVDFLDSHREYMLCAGNTRFLRNGELADYVVEKKYMNNSYDFDSYVNATMPFIHTSAIMVRNTIFINGLPDCYKNAVGTFEECALRGEDFRRILHLEKGPLYAFDDVVSVYRIHEKGMWQGGSEIRHLIENAIGYNFYRKYFKDKDTYFFTEQTIHSYQALMRYLFLKKGIMSSYSMTAKDNYLFTSYLNEISTADLDFTNDKAQSFINKLRLIKSILKQ
ncbi:glycosyltransferase family 2 protein [Pseudobutyrivibrio ruminis]|uniref:glycosyltransferase family 2 protein n=1 Tax=Pseudobutyrivibrio ruminis TaxID=46206 RepID=UPI0004253663|nr:glycosyltransferase family 2 protein [Pseudobutyrivibrio ruminis]